MLFSRRLLIPGPVVGRMVHAFILRMNLLRLVTFRTDAIVIHTCMHACMQASHDEFMKEIEY